MQGALIELMLLLLQHLLLALEFVDGGVFVVLQKVKYHKLRRRVHGVVGAWQVRGRSRPVSDFQASRVSIWCVLYFFVNHAEVEVEEAESRGRAWSVEAEAARGSTRQHWEPTRKN